MTGWRRRKLPWQRGDGVAVITAIYGSYDSLKAPPRQDMHADWIVVTDRDDYDCPPWRPVVEARPHVSPRMGAKVAKARPDLYAQQHDLLIWIDASFRITSRSFVSSIADALGERPVGADYYAPGTGLMEGAKSMAPWYPGQPVVEQAQFYLDHGHPDLWGSWGCGMMAWNRLAPPVVGDAWLAEMVRWSEVDEVSFPWVARQYNLRPVQLGYGHLAERQPHLGDRLAAVTWPEGGQ